MAKSSEVLASLGEVKSTLSGLINRQAELKKKIGEINGQIEVLQNMPLSLDDYCSFIPGFIQSFGAGVFSSLKRSMANGYNQSEGNAESWGELEKENGEITGISRLLGLSGILKTDNTNLEIIRYFCFFFPDIVSERIIETLKNDTSVVWGNDGFPPVAERRETVRALVAQRTPLEKELSDVSTEIQSINSLFSQMPQTDTEESAAISSLRSDMVVTQHAPGGFSIQSLHD